MKYLLLTANIDYADEFDCEMFGVFTDNQWKTLCKKTEKYFKEWKNGGRKPYSEGPEVGFGTNESLTFDNYKDWRHNFREKEITEEQYNFLKNNFGQTFGTADRAFFIGNFTEYGDIIELEE